MKKLIFCFAVLSFFVSCEPAVNSDHLSSIAGRVFESGTNNPIANAEVYTSPQCGKNDKTDGSGNFKLENIKVQYYSVYASKEGYETNDVKITTVAGELSVINIALKKLDDKEEKE